MQRVLHKYRGEAAACCCRPVLDGRCHADCVPSGTTGTCRPAEVYGIIDRRSPQLRDPVRSGCAPRSKGVVLALPCEPTSRDIDVSFWQGREGSPFGFEVRATLARLVSRRRPPAAHGDVLSELARVADSGMRRTPSQLEAVFALDAGTARHAPHAHRAVSRAREPKQQDREPALVGAVRPDAIVPARVPGVRSRRLGSDDLEPMAADAPRADRATDPASRSRRQGAPVPGTSTGSRRSGPSFTRCSRSRARRSSSASSCRWTGAATRRRSSTSTCWCWCCSSCTPGTSPRSTSTMWPTSFGSGASRCASRSRRRRRRRSSSTCRRARD